MIRLLIVCLYICTLSFKISALEASQLDPISKEKTYTPFDFKNVFLEIPNSLEISLNTVIQKKNIPYWVGVLGSTALLYKYDEDILRESEKFGRDSGIGNKDNTKTVISYKTFPLLRLPTDTGSLFYFLGDGWTHLGIAFGHYLYGQNTDNAKASTIGLQLMNGLATSTIINQVLKRASGRESPNTRTEYRGRWRPGPSFKAYGERTGSYDAMPSGHIMTATLTFTVLRNNYPDQEYWMEPLEYVWLTLLGYQMINNGVHWASDYPIGIATGYVVGNVVSKLGVSEIEAKQKNSWFFFPSFENNTSSLNALLLF